MPQAARSFGQFRPTSRLGGAALGRYRPWFPHSDAPPDVEGVDGCGQRARRAPWALQARAGGVDVDLHDAVAKHDERQHEEKEPQPAPPLARREDEGGPDEEEGDPYAGEGPVHDLWVSRFALLQQVARGLMGGWALAASGGWVGDGGGRVSHPHPSRVGALLLLCRIHRRLQIAPAPERPQTGAGISEGQGLRERRLQHAPVQERPPAQSALRVKNLQGQDHVHVHLTDVHVVKPGSRCLRQGPVRSALTFS